MYPFYSLTRGVNQAAHPEIQGVSVGAILSNYQRVRVEHVYVLCRDSGSYVLTIFASCSRLGLTSLAYLWQRNQAELLDEMIQGGMEAILIKVAGIGLTPDHLGKTLAQMQPHLIKLVGFQFFFFPSESTLKTHHRIIVMVLMYVERVVSTSR